jgi:hypothetical protein
MFFNCIDSLHARHWAKIVSPQGSSITLKNNYGKWYEILQVAADPLIIRWRVSSPCCPSHSQLGIDVKFISSPLLPPLAVSERLEATRVNVRIRIALQAESPLIIVINLKINTVTSLQLTFNTFIIAIYYHKRIWYTFFVSIDI